LHMSEIAKINSSGVVFVGMQRKIDDLSEFSEQFLEAV
jgi:hypothetical protein